MDMPLVTFVLGSLTIFASFGYGLLYLKTRKSEQDRRDRVKVVDRFESPEELERFLTSEGGDRYLKSLGVRRPNPLVPMLQAVPAGFVLLFIGFGMLLGLSSGNLDEGLGFVAVLFTGGGLGILVSIVFSHFLARAWGFLNRDDR